MDAVVAPRTKCKFKRVYPLECPVCGTLS
eukprot:COSAG02_NODE_64018_length_261_cov_1.277778_1_plen_28_part_01